MTKYLVLYRSSVAPEQQMNATTPEEAQSAMELWMTWAGKAGDAIVDLGSPVSRRATVGTGESGQPIGGFSILQAESETEVKNLLEDHPHFHSPGDPTIEVLEFLPVPGT